MEIEQHREEQDNIVLFVKTRLDSVRSSYELFVYHEC
jgi:hypothetical protein